MVQVVGAVLALFMIATPAAAAGMRAADGAPEARRTSGTLVKVAPDGSSIALEEMGPWQGPGTGVTTRSIHIAPGATVSLVEHTGRWEGPTASHYGGRSHPAGSGTDSPGTATPDADAVAHHAPSTTSRPAAGT